MLKIRRWRGGSFLISIDKIQFVLRNYRRGGLVEPMLKNKYLWTGKDKTRPALEFKAVEHALKNGVSVPEVVAYQVIRKGLFYKASIVSRYIENKGTLAQVLAEKPLPIDKWMSLGEG